ncbi:hypothetical protein FRC06_007067 [Ceratobasidium sp. 370]|nr:hypothetical protein FRC06_007067 [Ceratobasidium sp. 370]
MALDLPPLVVPTMSLQVPEMSEKYGATPTIIITPSSPSSDLDFQILHIPPPPPKPWTARLRMPWSSSWSKRGPIALESPPLDCVRSASAPSPCSWLRVRLRTAMMVAVPLVVVAAHVVIARHYGLGIGMDLGGSDESHSAWITTGTEMHSEA